MHLHFDEKVRQGPPVHDQGRIVSMRILRIAAMMPRSCRVCDGDGPVGNGVAILFPP